MAARHKWHEPQKRAESYANKVCDLANYDIEMSLDMWRIGNISLAKRCIEVIPHSEAARRYMLAARRGDIPLCNAVLNQR